MQRSFPVSNAGLAAASGYLAACMRELGLGEAVTHRFSVILDEICANMMRHDPSLDETTEFTLDIAPTEGGAQMTISDPGQPFNPLEFRHAAQPEIGGHGITLIKGLSNAVSYAHSGGMNRLTVTVLDQ